VIMGHKRQVDVDLGVMQQRYVLGRVDQLLPLPVSVCSFIFFLLLSWSPIRPQRPVSSPLPKRSIFIHFLGHCRYLLRARAERMEKKNMNYGLLSHVIREGGIVMATIVRFSAIPG
jgi:hypothetical protein